MKNKLSKYFVFMTNTLMKSESFKLSVILPNGTAELFAEIVKEKMQIYTFVKSKK